MELIIRMAADSSLISKAIRFITWSDFSHCDFVLPEGGFLGAVPGKGTVLHDTKYPVEKYFKVVFPEGSKVNPAKILAFARAQVGVGYDYLGVVGFAFHKNWQLDTSWFCSELITAAIETEYVLFNEKPWKISPRDLAISDVLVPYDPTN